MAIDYRDITIKVDCERYVVSIIYKGGGGLHLPFNRLEIKYPTDENLEENILFVKKGVCDDR